MKKSSEQKMDQLEQIKRLIILGLIKDGIQGKDIAKVLNVDPATITRIVPSRQLKK